MIAAGGSNCKAAQLDLAFDSDRVMCCNEELVMLPANSAIVHCIKIGFSCVPKGQASISTFYHWNSAKLFMLERS